MSVRNLTPLACLSLLGLLGALTSVARGADGTFSSTFHGPVTSCSELHVTMEGRDAVMKSEERTITRAEASTLKVHPHTNGAVQVWGWDKDTYSVTVCKFAEPGPDAESLLSQISLNVQGGEVTTSGPENQEHWNVHLLIRTPKSASLDLQTQNGPLAIYSVDGKLITRATNGPVSLKDVSGDAEITSSNGPISIVGGSGSLHIHTTNGPVSVSLSGSSWNGSGLTADAQNGPLTLRVPANYQSSFVVESSSHAPLSCKAEICGQLRNTSDEGSRHLEFGSGPAVIRVSTVNGPVSVQTL